MKLYATITSERASKGQGGNKFIRTEYNVGSTKDSQNIATINLVADDRAQEFRISAVLFNGSVVPIHEIPYKKGDVKSALKKIAQSITTSTNSQKSKGRYY